MVALLVVGVCCTPSSASSATDRNPHSVVGRGCCGLILRHQVGRGVVNRFDKARTAFFERCEKKKQGVEAQRLAIRVSSPGRGGAASSSTTPAPSMVKAPDESCGWWKLQIKGLGVIKFRPSNETRLTGGVGGGWQGQRDPGCAQSDPGGGPSGGAHRHPQPSNHPTSR